MIKGKNYFRKKLISYCDKLGVSYTSGFFTDIGISNKKIYYIQIKFIDPTFFNFEIHSDREVPFAYKKFFNDNKTYIEFAQFIIDNMKFINKTIPNYTSFIK